jgi:hypothetical protein
MESSMMATTNLRGATALPPAVFFSRDGNGTVVTGRGRGPKIPSARRSPTTFAAGHVGESVRESVPPPAQYFLPGQHIPISLRDPNKALLH